MKQLSAQGLHLDSSERIDVLRYITTISTNHIIKLMPTYQHWLKLNDTIIVIQRQIQLQLPNLQSIAELITMKLHSLYVISYNGLWYFEHIK